VEETQSNEEIQGKTERRRDCCTVTIKYHDAAILSTFIFPTADMAVQRYPWLNYVLCDCTKTLLL
jgi:hypothetical protein